MALSLTVAAICVVLVAAYLLTRTRPSVLILSLPFPLHPFTLTLIHNISYSLFLLFAFFVCLLLFFASSSLDFAFLLLLCVSPDSPQASHSPPEPWHGFYVGHMVRFAADPVSFLASLLTRHRGTVTFNLAGRRIVLIRTPPPASRVLSQMTLDDFEQSLLRGGEIPSSKERWSVRNGEYCLNGLGDAFIKGLSHISTN